MRAVFLAVSVLASAAAAGAQAPPPEALVGELSFRDSAEMNRIFLDLAPDSSARRLNVMLDTGASYSVFSPQAAKEAGVRPRRTKDTDYRRETRLGRTLHFLVDTSYGDHRTETGWNAGLLGGNFLERYVLEIDFPARVVRFWDAKKYSVPKQAEASDEAVVPMRLNARRPVIEVSVNGVTIPVLVDTGDPSGLSVSGDQAEKMGLESIPGVEFRWSGTVGSTTASFADGEVVKLGSFELTHAPLFVMPHGFFNIGTQGGALLGYDLLAEFVVRFDYRKGRAWFKHVEPRRRLFSLDYAAMREAGALLMPDASGGAQVWGMVAEGPAARRGVRPGDHLSGAEPALALAESLREKRDITVAREVDGALWDEVLPATPVSTGP